MKFKLCKHAQTYLYKQLTFSDSALYSNFNFV